MSRDGGQRDIQRWDRNDPTMRRGRPLVTEGYDCIWCYRQGLAPIPFEHYKYKPLSHRIERRVYKIMIIAEEFSMMYDD